MTILISHITYIHTYKHYNSLAQCQGEVEVHDCTLYFNSFQLEPKETVWAKLSWRYSQLHIHPLCGWEAIKHREGFHVWWCILHVSVHTVTDNRPKTSYTNIILAGVLAFSSMYLLSLFHVCTCMYFTKFSSAVLQ